MSSTRDAAWGCGVMAVAAAVIVFWLLGYFAGGFGSAAVAVLAFAAGFTLVAASSGPRR